MENKAWIPQDGGPFYCETPDCAVSGMAEPWNAWSSLFILLPGIYFLYKLRGRYRDHLFLTVCIPLLMAGGMGSTLYHASRDSSFFLYMDVLPTLLLFVAISAYLWYRVLGQLLGVMAVLVVGTGISVMLYQMVPGHLGTNLAYLVRGTVFFVPVLVLMGRTAWRDAAYMGAGIMFFILALIFRAVDQEAGNVLPMGTHFLWHVCTGLGGLLVAEYIYKLETHDHADELLSENSYETA